MQILPEIIEFVWDKGNEDKSKKSHNVEWWECEEVFLNFPLYLFPDIKHSEREERFFAFRKSSKSATHNRFYYQTKEDQSDLS